MRSASAGANRSRAAWGRFPRASQSGAAGVAGPAWWIGPLMFGDCAGACGTSLRFAGLALAVGCWVPSDVSRETIGGCRAGTWWLSDSCRQQLLREGPEQRRVGAEPGGQARYEQKQVQPEPAGSGTVPLSRGATY